MEKNKIKELGQFNTKPSIIQFILKQKYMPKDKSVSILEPSSGEGNFVNALRNYGYNNIVFYDIDNKYKKTGTIIKDFLKIETDKKFDLIIGNPPFTSVKLSNSYYGERKTKFKTRFIEMLFLEKSLKGENFVNKIPITPNPKTPKNFLRSIIFIFNYGSIF